MGETVRPQPVEIVTTPRAKPIDRIVRYIPVYQTPATRVCEACVTTGHRRNSPPRPTMSSDSPPTRRFVITVLSRDRVGIIADVSRAISALQGDIADMRESVLCGYLTMIMLTTFPDSQTAEALQQSLRALNDARRPGLPLLDVIVRPADDALPATGSSLPSGAYVLTVTGTDHIGLVAAVSGFCARHQINILDLSTAVADGAYTMILLIDLSGRRDVVELRRELRRFGEETHLCLVLQHYAIFKATNEVSLL